MDLLVKEIAKGKVCGIQRKLKEVVISSVVNEVRLVREVSSRRRWQFGNLDSKFCRNLGEKRNYIKGN